jgi:hypothetical protein
LVKPALARSAARSLAIRMGKFTSPHRSARPGCHVRD